MTNKIISYVGEDLIIECKNLPKMGQNILIDAENGRVIIARVHDLIGRANAPYAVATFLRDSRKYIKSYEELINMPVYYGGVRKKNKYQKYQTRGGR